MDPLKITCGAKGVHTLNLPKELAGFFSQQQNAVKGGGPQLYG